MRLKSRVIRFFEEHNFIRHVTILSGASVAAQLINIAVMPVVSRLYTPADFGVLALYNSLVGLLATVSGFRYYLVLPLARRERYIHAIAWLSFIAQCICTLLFAVIIELTKKYVAGTSYDALLPYRWLIPLGVLCVGIYNLLVQWAITKREFAVIARTKLVQTLSRAMIFIACGLAGVAPAGLLLGFVAGQSAGSTSLFRSIKKKTDKVRFSLTHIKRAALSYRKMFLYETPAAFINMSGTYMLPIIMTYFWLPDEVGSFSMAQQVLALPSIVVGTAIGQVFIQRCSQAKYDGNVGEIYLKTLEALFVAGVGPILLISMVAPSLFPVVLGSKWVQAGRFAMLLSPWIAMNFVYSPLSMIYVIMMLQRPAFVFISIYTAARLASVYTARSDPELALALLSGVGAVFVVIGVIFPAPFIKVKITEIVLKIVSLAVKVLACLAPLFAALWIFRAPLSVTVAAFFLSSAFYLWLAYSTLKSLKAPVR
jgi:O-antigen/teichoic acid export membrane protein